MATTPSTRERIDKMIDQFSYCMLITENDDGELRARPMAVADHEQGGDLYFFTIVGTSKVDEIQQHCRSAITMQSSNAFLSLSGNACVIRNKEQTSKRWSPKFKPWFPDGVDTKDLALLKFTATAGEIWDQSKPLSAVRYLWEMGKAVVMGERMDSDKSVVHERATLATQTGDSTGDKIHSDKGYKMSDFEQRWRNSASATVAGDMHREEE